MRVEEGAQMMIEKKKDYELLDKGKFWRQSDARRRSFRKAEPLGY
jgi:hypothetical protein